MIALFDRRALADLAVERLVQECGIDRTAIFVEAAEQRNSAGSAVSGGDAAAGEPTRGERADGALNGAIRLTVGVDANSSDTVNHALADAGAVSIEPAPR